MSDVEVPSLGEDIREAAVLKVLVSEGDSVEKEQPLLELETDKTTFELPCPFAGTVTSVAVSEGDTVSPGQSVLQVDEGGDDTTGEDEDEDEPKRKKSRKKGDEADEEQEKKAKKEKKKKAKKEKKEKDPGGGSESRGEPSEEDASQPDEPADESEDSGEAEAASDDDARDEGDAGEDRDRDDSDEDEDARGGRKARAAERGGRSRSQADRPARGGESGREDPDHEDAGDDDTRTGEVAAAPATRRLARELGVDLAAVRGSGAGNRITQSDVKDHVRRSRGEPKAPPDFERWGPVERQRLNGVRRATARRLAASWPAVPQVTHHERADVTDLERARRRHEDSRDEDEPRLTVTALVVKAAAVALRAFPRLNASLDMESEELVLKGYVNVGVAVDTEAGLLVPVVREADRRPLAEIAADLTELSARARRRDLDAEALEGGTFTVTSLGGIGGTAFTPLVNPPQVAILGVARAHEEPVLRDGALETRLWLPLSLSYDHRAIDGAEAARFCRWLARRLSDPLQLLMEA